MQQRRRVLRVRDLKRGRRSEGDTSEGTPLRVIQVRRSRRDVTDLMWGDGANLGRETETIESWSIDEIDLWSLVGPEEREGVTGVP